MPYPKLCGSVDVLDGSADMSGRHKEEVYKSKDGRTKVSVTTKGKAGYGGSGAYCESSSGVKVTHYDRKVGNVKHGVKKLEVEHVVNSKGESGLRVGGETHLVESKGAVGYKLLGANANIGVDGASIGAQVGEVNVGPLVFRAGLKVGVDKDGYHAGPVGLNKKCSIM